MRGLPVPRSKSRYIMLDTMRGHASLAAMLWVGRTKARERPRHVDANAVYSALGSRYQGCSLHHSGHLTLWGIRVAFTTIL
jgi:hypothetical protein